MMAWHSGCRRARALLQRVPKTTSNSCLSLLVGQRAAVHAGKIAHLSPTVLRRRLAIEPDRHAGFEPDDIALRVEPQAQRVAIMVADRTLRLPSGERSKRHELGDDSRRGVTHARPHNADLRSDRETAQPIFPHVKR